MPVTFTAGDAQPGDVVLAPDGNVYRYAGEDQWEQMSPVGSYGPPFAPAGDLTLLVRDGQVA